MKKYLEDLKTLSTFLILLGFFALLPLSTKSPEIATAFDQQSMFWSVLHDYFISENLVTSMTNEDAQLPVTNNSDTKPSPPQPESYPVADPAMNQVIDKIAKNTIEATQDWKLELPLHALVIGDSMMLEGFGPRIEKDLESAGFEVTRQGEYSSGLNTPRLDWLPETEKLINQNNPDILLYMFGSNDGQSIPYQGRRIPLSSSEWDVAYASRVNDYLSMIVNRPNAPKLVYIIGQPIPRTSDFERKFRRMNKINKAAAQQYPSVYFVDSWDRFAINGKFSAVVANNDGKKGTVKYSDGVHLTPHGSGILSDLVFDYLKTNIKL